MIIKYKPTYGPDLPICWLFLNYYRVMDEKLFFLLVIEKEVVFETVDQKEYENAVYQSMWMEK